MSRLITEITTAVIVSVQPRCFALTLAVRLSPLIKNGTLDDHDADSCNDATNDDDYAYGEQVDR